jgi:DNA-binding LytR/AlgR family response regulator
LGDNVIKAICFANSLTQARRAIEEFQPDVILFDIHLPDGQIFDAAEHWLLRHDVPLICMSAYPRSKFIDHVLATQAIAFIEKGANGSFFVPLKKALYKASEILRNRQQAQYFVSHAFQEHDRIRTTLDEIQEQLAKKEHLLTQFMESEEIHRLFLPKDSGASVESAVLRVDTGGGDSIFVPIQDIVCLESEKNYVLVHCKGKEEPHRERATLGDYEKRLQDKGFVRVHRSFLVPMGRIQKIDGEFAVMQNGKQIPIAEDRLKNVRAALREYHEKR